MWRKGITQLLGTGKDLKIMDIGTGTGFLALLLAEMEYNVIWTLANPLIAARDWARFVRLQGSWIDKSGSTYIRETSRPG